jgi:Domain of unknown function (DUF5655)
VTRNASHSCVQLTLDEFFGDRREQRELYEALLEVVRGFGPVTVNVNKSRISFQARVRFATVARVTRSGLVCTFWLKREITSARISRVDLFPPSNYVHQFRLTDVRELDAELHSWLRDAYQVGRQETEIDDFRPRVRS